MAQCGEEKEAGHLYQEALGGASPQASPDEVRPQKENVPRAICSVDDLLRITRSAVSDSPRAKTTIQSGAVHDSNPLQPAGPHGGLASYTSG
jgi:hypothetical protein